MKELDVIGSDESALKKDDKLKNQNYRKLIKEIKIPDIYAYRLIKNKKIKAVFLGANAIYYKDGEIFGSKNVSGAELIAKICYEQDPSVPCYYIADKLKFKNFTEKDKDEYYIKLRNRIENQGEGDANWKEHKPKLAGELKLKHLNYKMEYDSLEETDAVIKYRITIITDDAHTIDKTTYGIINNQKDNED